MKEIEDSVKKQIELNPEYKKELDRLANKFFFYSAGGWISETELLKRSMPSYIKKAQMEEFMPVHKERLQTILVALLANDQAIQKIESDGVPRFKFTENPELHLEFLQQELNHLNNRRDYILKKIQQFEEIKESKK